MGSIHFEGRLCEELLRLSSDGVLRCFTPYDCEKPRLSIHATEILCVESVPHLFLGRFPLWQVHTGLRVFVFCCADGGERDQWVSNLQQLISHFESQLERPERHLGESPRDPTTPKTPATWKSSRSNPTDVLSSMAKKAAGRVAGGAFTGLRAITGGQRVPSKEAMLLMDSTRARRWGNRRRLVLNDRLLTSLPEEEFGSEIAQRLLDKALFLGQVPAAGDVAAFLDATCLLKAWMKEMKCLLALRPSPLRAGRKLSSWPFGLDPQVLLSAIICWQVNIYHCLLLHGFLIFGVPQTKSELTNFRNRASYLIGSRPMSLREIESAMLHVPRVDPQAAHRARARARQLLTVFGCCGKKPKRTVDSTHYEALGQSDTLGPMCLPKMQLPKSPWASGKAQACLYLGATSEIWLVPKQDLRAVVTLNRGTLGCLSAIPILDAENLEAQLDSIAHQFVSTFVEVQLRENVVDRATLPMSCRGILGEFGDEERGLLAFLWRFMAREVPPLPERKVRVKFKKFPQDARPRSEFFKAILPAETSMESFESLSSTAKAGKIAECIDTRLF